MVLFQQAVLVCRSTRGQLHVALKRGPNSNGSAHRYSTKVVRHRPLQIAIIGSGPAGYYTAFRLQKKLPDVRIDMFEQLPVPYGLVRFGVAPDHPEVKKSAETLETVAESPSFNFVGNVSFGDGPLQLPLRSIMPHYDAILFAYGASKDRRLGIPGEDFEGVLSARAFVGWYNGLPQYRNLNPNLQAGETAVIIGQGNVALDVARFLLSSPEALGATDVSEHAIEALSKSKIRDVKVIGRRGPLQAPYTIKELRELMQLPRIGFVPPPEPWDDLLQVDQKTLPRQLKRIAELLQKGAKTSLQDAQKAWQLGYLRAPTEFLSPDGKNVGAIGLAQMSYTQATSSIISGDPQGDLNAIRAIQVRPTGMKSVLRASLAFKSVGYQSEALPGFDSIGIPFDSQLGIIPNDMHGRVITPERGPAGALTAGHIPGMYCAGWVKRGPTGVIASTLDDAFHTGDIIARDWKDGVKFNEGEGDEKGGLEAIKPDLSYRRIRTVSWQDWQRIDAEEKRRGQEKGKVREKCQSTEDMFAILDS